MWTSDRPRASATSGCENGKVTCSPSVRPRDLRPLEQEQQQISRPLLAGPLADAQQMLVEHPLLARCDPGQVEGEAWLALVELPKAVALEHAEQHAGQRFRRMLHLGKQRGLEADEIARQEEIEDLPAAILEQLVAEPPAGQDRVDVGALAAFRQNRRARVRRSVRRS